MSTYTVNDQRKQLASAAIKATKYEPEGVLETKTIENLQNCLCLPLHHSILGNKYNWSRPSKEFFSNESGETMKASAKIWHCFELLLLSVNSRFLGSPLELFTNGYEIPTILFPKYDPETENPESEGNDTGNGQRNKKSQKKRSDKKPPVISKCLNFGYSFNSKLSMSLNDIYNQFSPHFELHEDIIMFKKTKNKPTYFGINPISNEQLEHPQELSEDQIAEEFLQGTRNLLIPEEPGQMEMNRDSTDDTKQKFSIHVIKVPSTVSTDINSIILVIEQHDPNFDLIQLMYYITKSFIDSSSNPGSLEKPKNSSVRSSDVSRSIPYGYGRPFKYDSIFNGGSFYYENMYDSANKKTIKCPSITDYSPKLMFSSLLDFYYLAEQAYIRDFFKTNDQNQILSEEQQNEKAQMMKNLVIKIKAMEKKIETIVQGKSFDDSYSDYFSIINPNLLFTFENSVRILQMLEDINNKKTKSESAITYDIMSFFKASTVDVDQSFIDKRQNLSNLNSTCFNNFDKRISTLVINEDYGLVHAAFFKYMKVQNFMWMKSDDENSVLGLCDELLPWVRSIYAIPQSLLRYAVHQKKYMTDNKQLDSTADLFDIEIQKIKISLGYNTSNEMDEDFITHEYATWKKLPFDPTTFKDSFIPTCRLPVAYNHVTLHGACLLYRYAFMEDLKPAGCNIFSFFGEPFKLKSRTQKGKTSIDHLFYEQKLLGNDFNLKKFDNIEVGEYDMNDKVDDPDKSTANDDAKTTKKKWLRYCEKQYLEISKKIEKINEYSIHRQRYNLETTLYFSDTFINGLATQSFKLTDATTAIINYYSNTMKENNLLITPSHFSENHGLGNRSILPTEDLMGLHIEDLSLKLSILKEVKGFDKIKIILALWAGPVLGHMDMTLPLKSHIFIGGQASVGKSFILELLYRFLISGTVKNFSGLSPNAFFVNGDTSGSVFWSEEAIKNVFDKDYLGKDDFVNYFKAWLSDGNLSKMFCNIDTGGRDSLFSNHFMRCSLVMAFNNPASDLNHAIRSRCNVFTLGKHVEHGGSKKKDKSRHLLNQSTLSKKRKFIDNATANQTNSHIEKTYKLQIENKAKNLKESLKKFEEDNSMQIDEIVVANPNLNPNPNPNLSPTPNLNPNPNQSQSSQNNDISDDDILKEMSDRHKSDIEYISKKTHLLEIEDDAMINFIQKLIITAKLTPDDDLNCTNLIDDQSHNFGDLDSVDLNYFKTIAQSLDSTNTSESWKNVLKINLDEKEELQDCFKNSDQKKNNFDTESKLFETPKKLSSSKSLEDYIHFESMVAYFVHSALLEKRMTLSSHVFWSLIPSFIEILVEKYPFIKIDNRSILKMERFAYNLTIDKAFREKFMSKIDPHTGKKNEKHFVPFQPHFILDMAPYLFMNVSVVCIAFTLVSGEFLNPWYTELFNSIFGHNFTGYVLFTKSLMYYDTLLKTRVKRRKTKAEKQNKPNGNNEGVSANTDKAEKQNKPNGNNEGVSANTDNNRGSQANIRNDKNDNYYYYPKIFQKKMEQRSSQETNKNSSTHKTEFTLNIPGAFCMSAKSPSNGKTSEDSIFGLCKFAKLYVEIPNAMPNTFVDMNYVVLYDVNGRNGGVPLSLHDQGILIANFVKSKNFGEKMTSIGDDAIAGLLRQLLQEMISVKNYYLPVKKEVFTKLQEDLEFNTLNGIPLDTIYLNVDICRKSEIFPILTIKNVEIAKGSWRNQIWLCTHSIVKSNTDSCLTDIIEKVLSKTKTRQEIITLASSADKVREAVHKSKPEELFLNSGFLEKCSIGLKSKIPQEKIEEKTKKYVVKNDQNVSDIDPFFHVNFINNEEENPLLSHQSEYLTLERTSNSIANNFESTVNILSDNLQTLQLTNRTTEDGSFCLQGREDKQDENTAPKKPGDVVLSEKEHRIMTDINLYKIMINKIKSELPASSIQINLDLNVWAAQAHIIESLCSTMKIVDNSVDKNEDGLKDGIYYLHHDYPLVTKYGSSKDDYICSGEWRPIKSLSTSYISKKLYKYKWNYKDLNLYQNDKNEFMRWKYTILEYLNKIIKAPPINLIQNKTAYYSRTLGSYIPKYVLKDLYHYQKTLSVPSLENSSKLKITVNNGTKDDDFGDILLQKQKKQKT